MKKKVNKLHDVEVQAVGLVTVGANQEQFFLLKSQDAEDTMSDQVVENVAVEEVGDEVVESFATRLFKSLAAKFAATPPVVEEEVAQKAPEAEAVVEQQPEVTEEAEVAKADEEKAILQKANDDLRAELEEVQKKLADREVEVEKAEILKKAEDFKHVGVDTALLADNLYFLSKADQTRYEFWTNLLTAFETRSKDSGLFDEIGKSAGDEEDSKDVEAKLIELMKSSNGKSYSEILASMDREQSEAYLYERRAAMKK